MRPRRPGALALFLLMSAAVHGALLLAWPGLREREAGRVEVLEVTLMKNEPPRVSQAPEPPSHEPVREIRPKQRRADQSTASSRTAVPARPGDPGPQPQTLALTQPVGPAEPAFMVPQPPAESRLPAPEGKTEASPRQESARAATAGPQVNAAAPVAPPNFNATYLRNPAPRYPAGARRNGEQGTVTLKVRVTREGLPANVSVETTSGSASLDQAAADAVKGWRFAPARQGAQPVEAWVLVPIVFKLEG